jgi:hypothetical protein
MAAPKRPLSQRILEAEDKAAMYLGNYNEAAESGQHEKAAKLYDKAQFWLDRFNLLSRQGDRPAPKR